MDQPDTPEHCQRLGHDDTQAIDHPSQATPEPVEVLPRSPSPAPVPEDAAIAPFGAALAPILLQLCNGKLADLNWFRTDWQRGGALTGYATWTDETGQHDAVVKFPVP
ncbi:MAG: hypothetical protein AAF085_16465, partial [Planctomycetota bacterium]